MFGYPPSSATIGRQLVRMVEGCRLRNLPSLRFLQSAMIWRRLQSVKAWRAAPLTYTILLRGEINLVIIVGRESKYPRQMAVLQQPESRTQKPRAKMLYEERDTPGMEKRSGSYRDLRYF
jgi:hypothetical protein